MAGPAGSAPAAAEGSGAGGERGRGAAAALPAPSRSAALFACLLADFECRFAFLTEPGCAELPLECHGGVPVRGDAQGPRSCSFCLGRAAAGFPGRSQALHKIKSLVRLQHLLNNMFS